VAHIQYTICRSGTYYYNRRVPRQAVGIYGQFIRLALSKDENEAESYSKRLNTVLEGSWSGTKHITAVDFVSVLESFKPRSAVLSEMAEEYLSLREIDLKPPRIALDTFVSLAGDRDVSEYTREDAKLFVRHLTTKGNKTATIRRRINSLSAILNYAYSELDVEKRNPFTRMIIRGEGDDTLRRGIFSNDQLKQGYDKALASGSTVKLIMPLLGETGCRMAEIVGLRVDDIDMENAEIHIRPNTARRLKTRNSVRTLPLVGFGKLAMEQAMQRSDGEWLLDSNDVPSMRSASDNFNAPPDFNAASNCTNAVCSVALSDSKTLLVFPMLSRRKRLPLNKSGSSPSSSDSMKPKAIDCPRKSVTAELVSRCSSPIFSPASFLLIGDCETNSPRPMAAVSKGSGSFASNNAEV